MLIENEEANSTGRFFVAGNNKPLALLEYTLNGDILTIQHTEVDESLQGKKVGEGLVEQAVYFAREKNLKIFPACTFAAKVLKRNSSYYDVLLPANT